MDSSSVTRSAQPAASVAVADYIAVPTSTVADLAQIMAQRWATAVDVAVGPRRESLSQASKRWAELAAGLRASGDVGAGGPFAYTPKRDDGYVEFAEG